MAPKKAATKAKATKGGNDNSTKNEGSSGPPAEEPKAVKDKADKKPNHEEQAKPSPDQEASKKRSKAASTEEPRKASRRSGRGASRGEPSTQQLLNYLLSPAAAELTRPDEEVEDLKSRGDIRTYSASALNVFEELLCAVILSRPISHRLGLRTIRTVLNEPYNFTSARVVQDAGNEKRLQAVYEARTQHKDKTAAQMGDIAKAVLDNFTSSNDKDGTQLQKLRDECGDDIGKAADMLKSHVKGLGQTGLEIFFRRVQWIWTESFPNIDGRTADSLRMLGLPQDGETLQKLLEDHWKGVGSKSWLAGEGDEAKKRRAFVVLLERATGAQLEHKIDDVLAAAAEA